MIMQMLCFLINAFLFLKEIVDAECKALSVQCNQKSLVEYKI